MVDFRYQNVPIFTNTQLQLIRNSMNQLHEIHELQISLDLGISISTITINPQKKSFFLPNNSEILIPESFEETKELCYAIIENQIFPMESYDEETDFYYKLVPGTTKPYLVISSTRMHKEPFHRYLEKKKLKGKILDGGMGLGYTAIIASKTAFKVITVEIDENVIYYASFNPHSKSIFESENIQLIQGDITEIIKEFKDEYFDNIIQDGGAVRSSGTFFSKNQCEQLFRVLKKGGELYFYLPNPQSKKGRDFAGEHINRLKNAGFILKTRDVSGSFCVFVKSAKLS